MSVSAFEHLAAGRWMEAITGVYTDVIGGWFYLFLALGIIAAVQFKTESAENTSIVMILMGSMGLSTTLIPAINGTGNFNMVYIWGFMCAMGLALPFLKFVARRE